MDDIRHVTVPEAARILGKTPDAVRGLVRHGTLTATRGNDGRPRVILPANLTMDGTGGTPPNDGREAVATVATVATPGRDDIVDNLRERLVKTEGEAAQLRMERDQIMERLAQTRERAAKAEGEGTALRDALADLSARLDRAEARLAMPWWKRLFG